MRSSASQFAYSQFAYEGGLNLPKGVAIAEPVHLARSLQAGRSQPLAQARPGFGLSGLAHCGIPNRAGREQSGLLAQAAGLVGKALLQGGFRWCIAASLLHRDAPFHRGRRERNRAFSSPIEADVQAVIATIWHVRQPVYWSIPLTLRKLNSAFGTLNYTACCLGADDRCGRPIIPWSVR